MKAAHFASIDEETLAGMLRCLDEHGWFRFLLSTQRHPETRRMTFLRTVEPGTGGIEFMIALENGGCMFVDPTIGRLNAFLFIKAGFDIEAASTAYRILVNLLGFANVKNRSEPYALLEAPIEH